MVKDNLIIEDDFYNYLPRLKNTKFNLKYLFHKIKKSKEYRVSNLFK